MNTLLPSKKRTSTQYQLKINDDLVSDRQEVANAFNTNFNNILDTMKNIDHTCNADCSRIVENDERFSFEEVSVEFVRKELKSINCNKAVGIDKLHPKLLKLAADCIAVPLTFLYNVSLRTAEIPSEFKIAKIIPLYKGGNKLDINNYRPISLLPLPAKILERAVHAQLYKYLDENSLLSSVQSGFRPMHSTQTCVTDISEYILQNMNSGNITGAIFLDLRKAFDVISHTRLLQKLSLYGISNFELEWFKSYITDRLHCVSIEGTLSNYLNVKSGVPQGSTLGPLSFSIFINDIVNLVFDESSKLSLYADDTAIFCTDKNIHDVQLKLQSHFDTITKWLQCNDLFLNSEKTKVMLFGSNRKMKDKKLLILYKNDTLEVVNEFKYLGVVLDGSLNWTGHVDQVVKKISQAIGCIRRVKYYLTKEIMIDLFYSLILPHIDFSCTVWGSCAQTNIMRIQRLQNKYARMVLDMDLFTSTSFLLSTLNWQSVKQRIQYQQSVVVYKILNEQAPRYLNTLLQRRTVNYTTRYATRSPLFVPTPRTEYMKRSISYCGSKLFNSLPITVHCCNTLAKFKSEVRRISFTWALR